VDVAVSRPMSGDPQDVAEQLDDDATSGDDGAPDRQSEVLTPPERTHGIQFVDADVTDESFEERSAQEERELTSSDIDQRFADRDPPLDRADE
jgi:hypothetical protein